jgi:hypothetical protein
MILQKILMTFTVNNLTSIDQTTDTPTNNFATLNSLDNGVYHQHFLKEIYNCTLVLVYGRKCNRATIGVSTGKWYWELKVEVIMQ